MGQQELGMQPGFLNPFSSQKIGAALDYIQYGHPPNLRQTEPESSKHFPRTLSLAQTNRASYVRFMKWMISLVMAGLLITAPTARPQDAATQERLDKLSGQISDLVDVQRSLQKQLAELSRELDSLRSQLNRPNENNVTHNDLKPLAKAIEEVDRKRIDDAKAVQSQLANIAKSLEAAARKSERPSTRPEKEPGTATPPKPERGYEHEVKSGDTLSSILQAYREQGVKVSADQVLKANPGLKPEKMKVGQKIFIPAPEK